MFIKITYRFGHRQVVVIRYETENLNENHVNQIFIK